MTLEQRHASVLAHEHAPADDGHFAKVHVKCECGTRAIPNFRINPAFSAYMQTLNVPAEAVVGSAWCKHCEKAFNVTARDMKYTR